MRPPPPLRPPPPRCVRHLPCHALITLPAAVRFDGMYINIAQQAGGIEPLLDSFFGFLRRKTDFLNGAATETAAQETVIKAFKKNLDRHQEDAKEKAAKEKKRKAEEEKRKQRLEEEKAKQQKMDESRIEELTEEEAAKLKQAAANPAAPPTPAAGGAAGSSAGGDKEGEEGEEDEGKGAVPINNGGTCDNYRWTQTLQDLLVSVPVPAGTKAKGMTARQAVLRWRHRPPGRATARAPWPPGADSPIFRRLPACIGVSRPAAQGLAGGCSAASGPRRKHRLASVADCAALLMRRWRSARRRSRCR